MMSRQTGQALDTAGNAHLVQSIGDILTTPIGTRVGVRTYGSRLPDLVDQPANPLSRIRLYAAAAIALQRWEPRVRLVSIRLVADSRGRASLRLGLTRRDQRSRSLFDLTVPLQTA